MLAPPAARNAPAARCATGAGRDQAQTRTQQRGVERRLLGVVVLGIALALAIGASLAIGAKPIPTSSVLDAFGSYDPSDSDHLIIRELRIPRTVLGLLVGAALGAAGALMQGLTRNPLADPGLLGVNAGAAFAVVMGIGVAGVSSTLGLVWFAFAGAGMASVAVYALGSAGRGGATPVRLALAGAALSILLVSLTRAVTLIDQATLDTFRFWAVGSLSTRGPEVAAQMAPFIVAGLLVAIALARPLNSMALGDDTARALGNRLAATRAATGLAVTLLCGAAVAAAGPIGFVGLVIPHAVRGWFGPDQRWLLPAAALAGPTMLLACDVVGRIIARPAEVQVGITTAAIGGPIFVLLVRRTRMAAL